LSNDLEAIVRPSQTLDYAPAKVFYTPGQIGTPNTHLMIGRGGSGKVFSGSYNANSSSYMTQYVNEKKHADFGTAF
jgi:hypothetical protein